MVTARLVLCVAGVGKGERASLLVKKGRIASGSHVFDKSLLRNSLGLLEAPNPFSLMAHRIKVDLTPVGVRASMPRSEAPHSHMVNMSVQNPPYLTSWLR